MLYPDKPYNDSTVRSLLHILLNSMQHFLVIERINQKSEFHHFLLQELNCRLMKDLAVNKIKKIDDEAAFGFYPDEENCYIMFLIEIQKFNFTSLYRSSSKANNSNGGIDYLENGLRYLTMNYLQNIVQIYLIHRKIREKFNVKDVSITKNINKEFLKIPQLTCIFKGWEYEFAGEIFISLYRMFEDINDEERYFYHKDLFKKHESKMNRPMKNVQLSSLMAYCVYKDNYCINENIFLNELFQIYEIYIKDKYYKNKETTTLSENLYRAVYICALRLDKIKWTENFNEEYKNELVPARKECAYHLALSYLLIKRNEIHKALNEIEQVKQDNYLYKYNAKSLKLKILFMLYKLDEASQYIRTYMEFIKYDKIMLENSKIFHINYLYFFKKIIQFKEGDKKIELKLLRDKIIKIQKVLYRDWLLSVIKDLEYCK